MVTDNIKIIPKFEQKFECPNCKALVDSFDYYSECNGREYANGKSYIYSEDIISYSCLICNHNIVCDDISKYEIKEKELYFYIKVKDENDTDDNCWEERYDLIRAINTFVDNREAKEYVEIDKIKKFQDIEVKQEHIERWGKGIVKRFNDTIKLNRYRECKRKYMSARFANEGENTKHIGYGTKK